MFVPKHLTGFAWGDSVGLAETSAEIERVLKSASVCYLFDGQGGSPEHHHGELHFKVSKSFEGRVTNVFLKQSA